MRTKELLEHKGNLEGIVREAETFNGQVTRFRLESVKDDYYCFGVEMSWLQNGQYAEINFSGNFPLREQVEESVRARGRKVFKLPSHYPSGQQHPRPVKLFYVEVFELRMYDNKEKENLLHVYKAPIPLC